MTKATISMHGALNVDPTLRAETMSFLEKLMKDPASPGLHVEPIVNSVDPRVRTGRVNLQYRAVMFELTDTERHHFVVVGVYPHDDGIEKAKKVRLEVNPINGITRLIEETTPAEPTASEIESRRKAAEAERAAKELAAQQVRDTERVARKAAAAETASSQGPSISEVFAAAGHTPETLEEQLGINPAATRIVLALSSEDGIDNALIDSPPWERDALLGLAADMTVPEVRASLGIREPQQDEEADTRSEDEKTIDGLLSAAARMEFAYLDVADVDEMRKVIEAQDFNSWRVFIHPDQQSIVDADFSGSGRVFGGAGTGKTVVCVHRANRLVSGQEAEIPRVLLATYTRGLADSLKSQMNALNPKFPEASAAGEAGLWIGGIDAVVRMVLDRAEVAEIEEATTAVMGRAARRAKPFTGFEERETWLDALMVADVDLPPELATTDFLSREFESVVLANQITDQSGYLRVPRPGRGTALNRATRKKLWAVFDVFRNSSARDNKFDWATLAAIAAALLDARASRTGERVFDHVVIDEAQDFHAGHWRFLRASVAPGPNDIFLAEDSHQRIYGERHVLSHFGISTRGRASKRLTLNYRTTRENLDYAVQILTGEWFDAEGEPDNVDSYRSLRSGPRPTVLRFNSEEDEFAAVADLIGRWQDSLPDPRVGVLARTRAMVNRAVNGLADHGIVATKTRNPEEAAHEAVSVMSMHGAKGMEFTHVVLLGMGKESVPLQHRLNNLSDGDREDAEQRERALLYVAASRARDQVVVTTHTEPSELLPVV